MISRLSFLFLVSAWYLDALVPVQAFPAYYDISQIEAAKAEARHRTLPLAWMGISPHELDGNFNGPSGDMSKAVQPILSTSSVVILFDGTQSGLVPPDIYSQFSIMDDGVLPGGHHWNSPKVVFTNPEATKILGRVSNTQMQSGPEIALNSALQIIRNNPEALAVPKSAPEPAGPNRRAPDAEADRTDTALDWTYFLLENSFYIALGAALLLGFALAVIWSLTTERRK